MIKPLLSSPPLTWVTLMLWPVVIALAQEGPFVTQRWQVRDDLPHAEVRDVLQTRDGYIWVATAAGVGRYTAVHFGVQFEVFHSGNMPAMPNNFCNALAQDASGALWVGLDSGTVLRREHIDFTVLRPPPAWPEAPITRIIEAGPGKMLVLNLAGMVAEFATDQPPRLLTNGPPGGVLDLIRDSRGLVWLLSQRGLEPLGGAEQPALYERADSVCAARDGGLWVLSNQQLRRWKDGEWVEDVAPLTERILNPTCLLETRSKELIVGTARQGLLRLTRGQKGWASQWVSGLEADSVLALCEDHEGSLWAGTAGGGLLRLSQRRAATLPIPSSGAPARLLCAIPGLANDLWVGTEDAGLFHLSGEDARQQTLPAALRGVPLPSLHRTEEGTLWIGSSRRGLWVLAGEDCRPLPGWPWPGAEVQCIYPSPSSSGSVWVGMSDGLAVCESNRWQRVLEGEGVLQDDVRCVVEDGQGNLFFGTVGRGLGRLRLEDGTLVHFTRDQGLGSSTVYALLADSDGTVWVGTQGGGLARVKDGLISRITAEQGIRHDTVCQLLEDHSGRVWLAAPGGVVSASKRGLNDCADGKSDLVDARLFDLQEGFSRVDFVGGNQPAAAQTPDHRLWFVAGKGLGTIDPDAVVTTRELIPPPMVIETVRIGDVEIHLPTTNPMELLRLPAGVESLEISYNALSYIAPRRVRFQYQLAGVDDDWINAGPGRKVRFARLPPGPYTFRVRGSNSDGVWNAEGTTLNFHLAPYVWQTTWFTVSMSAAGMAIIAGIVYGLARVRHRRKLMLVEQRESLERERGRIARDMHDEVGAKLTRITVLSRLLLRRNLLTGKSADLLKGLADTARECVRRFDQIVWTVNPQNDNLQDLSDYLANNAISYFDNTGMKLRLTMPGELPELPVSATQRNNLLHAYEEAMSNALRHSGARTVEISMRWKDSVFSVMVKDDGKWLQRSETSSERDGLENMRLRMSRIHGQCTVESPADSGTRVCLLVPLAGDSK